MDGTRAGKHTVRSRGNTKVFCRKLLFQWFDDIESHLDLVNLNVLVQANFHTSKAVSMHAST